MVTGNVVVVELIEGMHCDIGGEKLEEPAMSSGPGNSIVNGTGQTT